MLDSLPSGLYALAIIFIAGGAVFYAIECEPGRYARLERIAYCYPLGLSALGMPMFLFSWIGLHINVVAISGLAVGAALAAIIWRRRPLREYWLGNAPDPRMPLTEFEWLLILIILLCLGARTVACALAPLNDWDGIALWGIKAKVLYYDTIKTTDYFHKPEYAYSHTPYPLLWPFMYAWVCTVVGQWDDLAMLVLNPVNFIAFTVLLYFVMKRFATRTVALGVTAIATSLPTVLHYVECGQADIPLMLIWGASLFCLFDWMQSRRTPSLLLAAVLMGGAMFTKQEGRIVFGASLCAAIASVMAGAPTAQRKKLFGHVAIYAFVALAWVSPWLIFQSDIKDHSWDFGGAGLSTVRWAETPALLKTIVANALVLKNQVNLPKWHILWPLFALSYIVSPALRRYPWVCLLLVFVLHAGGVGIVFLASHWAISLQGMEIAFERFAMVMLPPVWLILAKGADDCYARWRASNATRENCVFKRIKAPANTAKH